MRSECKSEKWKNGNYSKVSVGSSSGKLSGKGSGNRRGGGEGILEGNRGSTRQGVEGEGISTSIKLTVSVQY